MEREIKFRAWNTDKRRMSYQDGTNMQPLILRIDGALALLDKDSNDQYQYTYKDNLFITDEEGGNYHSEGFILMQYTGLKDKNGKEIYEGDILLGRFVLDEVEDHIFLSLTEEEKKTQSIMFVVEDIFYPYTNQIPEDLEVVGNTYENPELLSKLNNE